MWPPASRPELLSRRRASPLANFVLLGTCLSHPQPWVPRLGREGWVAVRTRERTEGVSSIAMGAQKQRYKVNPENKRDVAL